MDELVFDECFGRPRTESFAGGPRWLRNGPTQSEEPQFSPRVRVVFIRPMKTPYEGYARPMLHLLALFATLNLKFK